MGTLLEGFKVDSQKKTQVVPTVDKGSIEVGIHLRIFLQPGNNPSMKKVKGKNFGIFELIFS